MSFFDEISRKISQTGQEAYSKTKDLADVVKFNSAVSDEEKNLSKYYESLGRMYYSNSIGQSVPEIYTELIKGISESLKKISEYQECIKSLKGIKKCKNCGDDVPSDASFCIKCGSKVTFESTLLCKNCGSELPADASFCVYCGSKINIEEKESYSETSNEKRCNKCGGVIGEGDDFCTNCGAKIEKEIITDVQENILEEPSESIVHQGNVETEIEALSASEKLETQNVCPNCGELLEKGFLFCTNCGQKME